MRYELSFVGSFDYICTACYREVLMIAAMYIIWRLW